MRSARPALDRGRNRGGDQECLRDPHGDARRASAGRDPLTPAPALASLPAPRALVIDLDGTLVDTVDARIRSWLGVFEETGIPASREQVAPLIGSDGRRLARVVGEAAGRPVDPARAEAIDRRAGELYDAINTDPQPLPGARELLLAADERGLAWAIATSSRREQVGRSVDALRLPRPPTIVDGSDVAHAKPAPDLMLKASETLGIESAACWCIGDATWDMAAGAAAGMVTVGVTVGSAVDADRLRETGAAAVVETLVELGESLRRKR
jgi:phosphoglycolate phosphatase